MVERVRGSKEASINGQRRRLPGLIEYRRVVRVHTRMHSLSADGGLDIRAPSTVYTGPLRGVPGRTRRPLKGNQGTKNKKTNIRGEGDVK